MSGHSPFLGDFLVVLGKGAAAESLREALDRNGWPPLGEGAEPPRQHRQIADGLAVLWQGDAFVSDGAGLGGVALHHPTPGNPLVTPERTSRIDTLATAWRGKDVRRPEGFSGKFSIVLWDAARGRLAAFTDAFRAFPLYYATGPGFAACATDLRLLLASGLARRDVDPRAVYHYLNFAYVPTPFCIVAGVRKLEPGSLLRASPGEGRVEGYWDASYPEDLAGSAGTLAPQLRDRIVSTVNRYRSEPEPRWGTFLSGGTDSSSVSGILARGSDTPVESYSIGFDEGGFDELSYARLAASHFHLESHTRRVGPEETLAAIPRLVDGFDEPFGNSSAIPTYYCAQMARGRDARVLVAGDGGDEIFGGNERYRKDVIFEAYHRSRLLRGAGSTLSAGLRGVDNHLANRLKSFHRRGTLPNPDRFYQDDAFASDHYEELLSVDLRGKVGRDESLEVVRGHYGRSGAPTEIHRLMYLDLKMTISDSDLIKVTRASRMAGVAVLFPYLDADLVDFTGRLPGMWKVKGLDKRHLFKRAMQGILPDEILKKKKQGFGLPLSVWLRERSEFRDMLRDVVLSDRARGRGYFNLGFVEGLMDHHQRGAWDHGSRLFLLLMLELWHRAHVDR